MENKLNIPNISYYTLGLCMIAVSALVFFLPSLTTIRSESLFGLFAINFLITAVYFIVIGAAGVLKKGRDGMACIFLFLILFLISAYSLNREIPVFEESATWLGVLLVIVCGAYMLVPFLERMPGIVQGIVMSIIGSGLVLWIYLSVYLVPLYPLSAVASIGFGISLHSFLPLIFLLMTIKWVTQQWVIQRGIYRGLLVGIGVCVIITTVFCIQWNSLNRNASRQYQQSLIADNTDLPGWIKASSQLPDNWVTERFLKAGLVYSTPTSIDGLDFFGMPSRRIDEVRKHDPLVMMAGLFSKGTYLSEEDRIKILESKYDTRHKTEERLWTGANLQTQDVITNASIWPDMHIAYTEKTITVVNNEPKETWRRQQEAIYNFHLPEGSVVTSLSLWIDGKEAKGILTTKGKADTAYKQIVGVERHDPSVVHWQEGNTVSVRVFPVDAGDDRVFKIGVTTPLLLAGNKLLYKPISFEGPVADGAHETLRIAVNDNLQHAEGLDGFTKDEKGRYTNERSYNEGWQLSFDDPKVKGSSFAFGGNTYTLQPYTPQRVTVGTERVYLDVNSAWTKEEFDKAYGIAKGKKIYAFTDEMVHVNDDNRDKVYSLLHKNAFSIFPIFSIKEPETALLISKGTVRSPNVKDLNGSGFAVQLENGLKTNNGIRLYNIGDELSPYLKTLKERRAFNYEHGDLNQLKDLLDKGVFARNSETDSSVVIEDAGIRISKGGMAANASGPDHLMRLFAYNHLMQELGHNFQTSREGDTALVREASEAYVVSPLSSLVVLETAADYERFGIKDNNNSLHNASIKSSGAVPEPHEWALILIAAGILMWYGYRIRIGKKTRNV